MPELVIEEILRFFDGDSIDCSRHSAALNALLGEELGVILLTRFLSDKGGYREVVVLDHTCKTTGARLDCWISAQQSLNTGSMVLFQVEIKNWCAHSVGGRPLPLGADGDLLAARLRANWKRYWDDTARLPREEPLKKVLIPMQRPTGAGAAVVIPVACVWDALHPSGTLDPWFEVPSSGSFTTLRWFSMSSYLRTLYRTGATRITASLPVITERLRWVNQMVVVSP